MKEGWKYIDFKDVYPIRMGKTPPRGDKSSWDTEKVTSNKWVSIADISLNEGKTIYDTKEYISDNAALKINKVSKGSLLMSFKLSIGRMAFAGDDLYTNEAIIAIPEHSNYNLRFIYYYLLQYDWKSLTEGNEKVKGATLNKQSIGKIKLPTINLSEQHRIVSYLDTSFAQIDALAKQAEESLENAKALFQATLKELMEKKEGWEEKKLKDVCTIYGNYGLSVSSIPFNGIRYLRITDITEWGDLNDDKVSADLSSGKKQEKLEDGDILFARTGATVGKTLVYKEEYGECLFAGYLIRYRLNKGVVLPSYMYYVTHSPEYYNWVAENQKAAAQPNIGAKVYDNYLLHFPSSIKEQKSIVEKLDMIKDNIRQLQSNYTQTLANCQALKQALLRETFE